MTIGSMVLRQQSLILTSGYLIFFQVSRLLVGLDFHLSTEMFSLIS